MTPCSPKLGSEEELPGFKTPQTVLVSRVCCHEARIMPSATSFAMVLNSLYDFYVFPEALLKIPLLTINGANNGQKGEILEYQRTGKFVVVQVHVNLFLGCRPQS
jgi:hypothetical protein